MGLGFEVNGVLGVLALIIYIWAILSVAQSPVSTTMKAAWIVFLLLVPLIGFLVWFFFGPRASHTHRRRHGY